MSLFWFSSGSGIIVEVEGERKGRSLVMVLEKIMNDERFKKRSSIAVANGVCFEWSELELRIISVSYLEWPWCVLIKLLIFCEFFGVETWKFVWIIFAVILSNFFFGVRVWRFMVWLPNYRYIFWVKNNMNKKHLEFGWSSFVHLHFQIIRFFSLEKNL